jgi:protein-disulfide isomerase
VFKDFPLPNHTNAPKAHESAHCAGEQKKYWEMHDQIFAHQSQMTLPDLRRHAEGLKLDMAKFDLCVGSGKYAQAIEADIKAGEALGVNSTPTMYVNGRPVIGAQPFDLFKSVIDEELARAK